MMLNVSLKPLQMETCEEEVKVEPVSNPPHAKSSLPNVAEVATIDEAMTECSNTSNKIMSTAVVLASCTRTENYLEPVSSNGISAQAASVQVTQVSITSNQKATTAPPAAASVQFRVNEVTVHNPPSSLAAPSKRKPVSGDDSNSAKLTKFFYSQEMAVQTPSTGNSQPDPKLLNYSPVSVSEVTKTRTNVQP